MSKFLTFWSFITQETSNFSLFKVFYLTYVKFLIFWTFVTWQMTYFSLFYFLEHMRRRIVMTSFMWTCCCAIDCVLLNSTDVNVEMHSYHSCVLIATCPDSFFSCVDQIRYEIKLKTQISLYKLTNWQRNACYQLINIDNVCFHWKFNWKRQKLSIFVLKYGNFFIIQI